MDKQFRVDVRDLAFNMVRQCENEARRRNSAYDKFGMNNTPESFGGEPYLAAKRILEQTQDLNPK